jgi:hypothetical protein
VVVSIVAAAGHAGEADTGASSVRSARCIALASTTWSAGERREWWHLCANGAEPVDPSATQDRPRPNHVLSVAFLRAVLTPPLNDVFKGRLKSVADDLTSSPYLMRVCVVDHK